MATKVHAGKLTCAFCDILASVRRKHSFSLQCKTWRVIIAIILVLPHCVVATGNHTAIQSQSHHSENTVGHNITDKSLHSERDNIQNEQHDLISGRYTSAQESATVQNERLLTDRNEIVDDSIKTSNGSYPNVIGGVHNEPRTAEIKQPVTYTTTPDPNSIAGSVHVSKPTASTATTSPMTTVTTTTNKLTADTNQDSPTATPLYKSNLTNGKQFHILNVTKKTDSTTTGHDTTQPNTRTQTSASLLPSDTITVENRIPSADSSESADPDGSTGVTPTTPQSTRPAATSIPTVTHHHGNNTQQQGNISSDITTSDILHQNSTPSSPPSHTNTQSSITAANHITNDLDEKILTKAYMDKNISFTTKQTSGTTDGGFTDNSLITSHSTNVTSAASFPDEDSHNSSPIPTVNTSRSASETKQPVFFTTMQNDITTQSLSTGYETKTTVSMATTTPSVESTSAQTDTTSRVIITKSSVSTMKSTLPINTETTVATETTDQTGNVNSTMNYKTTSSYPSSSATATARVTTQPTVAITTQPTAIATKTTPAPLTTAIHSPWNKTMSPSSSTNLTTSQGDNATKATFTESPYVTINITMETVSSNSSLNAPSGLGAAAWTGIGMGVLVGFWVILGPIVCIICRTKDKAEERRERERSRDSMNQGLIEQMIFMELARGREKIYKTSITDVNEIEKLQYTDIRDCEIKNYTSEADSTV